jgi:Kef-type K+ transport system membrane component KefB
MNAYWAIIAVSAIVILSHLVGLLSRLIRIPSVLMLLVLGAAISAFLSARSISVPGLEGYIHVLGSLGLIFIVLEASLDLRITAEKRALVAKAAISALMIIVLSTAAIGGVLRACFGQDWRSCIVNALPLSVISSAITIPSIRKVEAARREFLTYEATFSDILGVLLFNVVVQAGPVSGSTIAFFALETGATLAVSIVIVVMLMLILQRSKAESRLFLVVAMLTLAYGGGKLLHLSPLLLILVFGLCLGNLPSRLPRWAARLLDIESLRVEVPMLHRFSAELSFFLRTFFFIVFGMSIKPASLLSLEVLGLGAGAIAVIFLVRFAFLKLIRIGAGITEVLISPRGLVTVLLVLSIPGPLRLGAVYDDVVYAVILLSGLVMTVGLLLTRHPGERFDLPEG